jgi:hypothetical protein
MSFCLVLSLILQEYQMKQLIQLFHDVCRDLEGLGVAWSSLIMRKLERVNCKRIVVGSLF